MSEKTNKSGTIFIIIVALAGLILGGVAISTPKTSQNTTSSGVKEDATVINNNKMFVIGNENAKARVVVFSDFLCPYCAKLHEQINEIIAGDPSKVAVNIRTFIIHEDSIIMSQAAYAAGLQGKFSEASNLLFSKYTEPTEENMVKMAEELKLDVSKFKNDLNSDAAQTAVETDNNDALKLGLGGTPSVFVNDKYLEDLNDLEATIEEANK